MNLKLNVDKFVRFLTAGVGLTTDERLPPPRYVFPNGMGVCLTTKQTL